MKDRELRRREILYAAIEVFAEKGYKKAHISDVVKKVGIAKGTFYLYFDSKKDLFLELIDQFTGLFFAKFEEIEFEKIKTAGDLREILYQISRIFFRTYKSNAELAKIVFREAVAIDIEFEKQLEKTYVNLKDDVIKRCFKIGEKKEFFNRYDPDIIVSALVGMIEVTAHDHLLKGDKLNPDQLAEMIADFACNGLLKK